MVVTESVKYRATKVGRSSQPASSEPPEKKEDNPFECHVCLDAPRKPVVTPCGHLYCWPCLYRWMQMHGDNTQCPVCKALVDKNAIIPIYGRDGPERRQSTEEGVPPRPSGHREQPSCGIQGVAPFGVHHPTLGRFNPYGAGYENLGLSAFELFPSLFGMQIAYPHMNERPRDEHHHGNVEDQVPDIMPKMLILLALFIAVIITTF